MNPVYRFIKESVASNEDILAAASKYYDNNDPDDPKHRWDHMLDVMDVAKKIRGRDLDPDEFGMIAFHDAGYKHPKGYAYAKSRHPMFGAKIFRKEGPGLGYSPEEVKRIAKVIAYHNHKPDYASSPLLKDDMQMLLFSADEGTPIDLKDDAKMYYVKGRNGVYKGVDPKSKDFIKQLVAKVKTFGNYSKLKRLKYYNDVYPGYLQSKYDFWQSPDLEKYYKELNKKDKKKEDKYSIHGAILGCLGDNAKKFKYNITEDLPGDPWEAIIHTKPMTMDKVKQFHKYHNVDVDKAGVPYYFLTQNERTGDKYVWYSDDAEPMRINTKEEIEYAQQVGRDKGLIPDQLNFKFTEKKAEFDLPDLQTNPKNKITRLTKNLVWGVKVDGEPISDNGILFKLDPNKGYEIVGDNNGNVASCVDLTNKVVKNMRGIGTLATMRSDGTVPHLTPLFKYKGKYYLRSGTHKYSDPYDSLEEIGKRWFKSDTSYPVPAYVDFYDLPAGTIINEKDLRKVIDEVKRKSRKSYRRDYTDREGYKKEKKASKDPDISDVIKAYKDLYNIDLSHMKSKWSKKPRFNNGKVNKDLPVESYGGSWAKNNTIYLNPDLKPVLKYYGLDEDEDSLRKTIVAHELAHEVYNKGAVADFIKQQLDEAKAKKFTTAYLEHVPEHKLDEEMFCEYLADGINKKANKSISFPKEEIDSLKGKNYLYTTRVSDDFDKYSLGDSVNTPWGDKYTVTSEDIYDDVKKHKFYKELTPKQKKLLKVYDKIKLIGLKKQAGKLYTYVDPEADLSQGILSARLAPEDVLMRRYPNSGAKNKKELIELMQTRFKDDKDRPDLIYALSHPIPDTANSRLLRFRANHKLVSYDTDKIKDLVKLLKRRYRKPPAEVKDVEPRKYIQWGRTPKDGGAFFYAPVYKVLTESGKIDPELLTIE